MKVTRLKLKDSRSTYRVYELNGLPNKDLNEFLRYLDKRDYASNTVRANAYDLIVYCDFLDSRKIALDSVSTNDLVDFIYHLRFSGDSDGLYNTSKPRSESSIARMFNSVNSLYQYRYYQYGVGVVDATKKQSFKGFLAHARKSEPHLDKKTIGGVFKRKSTPPLPKTISEDQTLKVLSACSNRRDRLLVMLLIETGMRIGQVLQLRHSDIESWESRLKIVYRDTNENEVFAKSRDDFYVDLSNEWLELYTDYILADGEDVESDYVFTSLYHNSFKKRDSAYTYKSALDMFNRLSCKVGFKVRPHMLRHTHATALLKAGTPLEIVAKRLGHKNVVTTMSIYNHLTHRDVRDAINKAKSNE
jgi:integrase/recombinase XerD